LGSLIMDEDGEGAHILVQIHSEVAAMVSANERGCGSAGGTFRAQGSDTTCTLMGGEMSEKGDINLIECQRGADTCCQEIFATTRAGREHLSAPFQEFEASEPDFRHFPLPGDVSPPASKKLSKRRSFLLPPQGSSYQPVWGYTLQPRWTFPGHGCNWLLERPHPLP
jgi:hypothetical protein